MGQSYRLRTEIGTNKTVNIQLDQDFEFLEILSLKLRQVDVYDRNCANYGLVVGRVTANNGFGIPNAKVSVFIPIESEDESNPIITSLYPYKSPEDKNEDGYRYNLLPYEKSYSTHAATGTFPSLTDVLSNDIAIEIYDKYYKLTSKTNDSGDYMIMGVPLGIQTIVMDVDLSDIGEFSLSPQDLIRMGIATESQVGGNTFRTSTDLNSLPQLITITKTMDISPLWGDQDICQVAINRLDFDLRDDANVDIRPTSVFMGSMFSSPEKMRVRPGFQFLGINLLSSAKPKDNLGNLCELVSGPGQILCIRQTINLDQDGNPILEEYKLEQSGNVIDGDGTWIVELPMNLDYVITNEFGEKVISLDPSIGVPTKGKYRFKIKWQQPPTLTEQTRRAYYLVPNIKEYGWDNFPQCDPNIEYNDSNDPNQICRNIITSDDKKKLNSSYYFGLDWSGYTNGFLGQDKFTRLDEIIECEDTFYEFKYNKVYTVSSLIDQWKRGGRGRFIGIKEIDDDNCASTINKFPVNEGFQNFDFLFFLFSILMTTLSFVFIPLLIVAHIILFLYYIVVKAICYICDIPLLGYKPFQGLCSALGIDCTRDLFTIRLPMITYPECSTCECKTGDITKESVGGGTTGSLSYVSSPSSYVANLAEFVENNSGPDEDTQFPEDNGTELEYALLLAQAIAGNDKISSSGKPLFKTPLSDKIKVKEWGSDPDDDGTDRGFASSDDLPLGERINIFNGRSTYFSGLNRIKVSFDNPKNPNVFHFDNTITVLSNTEYKSGDLLTFVDPSASSDVNFIYTATTPNGVIQGIDGINVSGPSTIQIYYADPNNPNNEIAKSYNLSTGTTITRQIYPSDREYYQVLTAITISDAINIWNKTTVQSFPNLLTEPSLVKVFTKETQASGYIRQSTFSLSQFDYFEGMENQYILIMQRGVDPYSPKFTNKYGIGKILGKNNEDDITFTASTRLNIPIQKTNNPSISVQKFTKDDIYYKSFFFIPGNMYSGFTSNSASYYGRIDKTKKPPGTSNGINNTIISINTNGLWSSNYDSTKYDNFEDLSGGALMFIAQGNEYDTTIVNYYSQVIYFYPNENLLTYPTLTKDYNVLRTDRLPSSDVINGETWEKAALLQQNNNFKIYLIPDTGENPVIPTFTTGAQQTTPDTEGLPGNTRVLESFDCEKMVSLKCYRGFGDNFRVDQKCVEKDNVERGCYLLLRRPLIDLGKDFKTYGEWVLRFRFFYGLCRGVLAQSFTNNWINGTLFAFPIQVNTFYDSNNKPYSTFARELIYYDQGTTNFYYRSSPYNISNNEFVGKIPEPSGIFGNLITSVNKRNLLFPTTIMDLGMKESFYSEIIYEPYSRGYVMSSLNPTSYSDMSDIVNLFVISRITDASFLDALIPLGDNSIVELFTRNKQDGFRNRRVDGDFAQAASINSEVGLINFSPEFYETPPCDNNWCKDHDCIYTITNNDTNIMTVTYRDVNGSIVTLIPGLAPGQLSPQIISESIDSFTFTVNGNPSTKYTLVNYGCATNESPTRVLGVQKNPTIAIWFSSTTENLQLKDYITPGRINFRTSNLQSNFPFTFGIKSQRVPFYQWEIQPNNNIFGTQFNNWVTDFSPNQKGFLSVKYQSLDRTVQPPSSYFMSNTIPNNDLYQRGYIFSVDANGQYSPIGMVSNKVLVGAPFQFYFGIIRGESVLDKFKKKYIADE